VGKKHGNGQECRVKDDDESHQVSRRVAENSLIMEDICIELFSSLFSILLAADEDLVKIIRIENF
jgi:hypothetical protein